MSSKSVKRLQRYGELTVFNMSTIRHLGFVKFEIFLRSERLRDPFCTSLPNFVKIGQTGAIFLIYEDGGRRHFGFSKIINFNDRSAVRGQYASLYQILSKSVKRLQRYSDLTVFSKWRPSAILDLLGADWDHTRRVLDGLYRCAKFS